MIHIKIYKNIYIDHPFILNIFLFYFSGSMLLLIINDLCFYKKFKQIKLIHVKIKGEKFYRNRTNIFKVSCLKK